MPAEAECSCECGTSRSVECHDCDCCDYGGCCYDCCKSTPPPPQTSYRPPPVVPVAMKVADPTPTELTSYLADECENYYTGKERVAKVQPEELHIQPINDRTVEPVLNWSLTEDPKVKFPVQKQDAKFIVYSKLGTYFPGKGIIMTSSKPLPSGDSPRTIMFDVKRDEVAMNSVSTILCYGKYGHSTWFTVSYDWESKEFIFSQGDVTVGSGIEMDVLWKRVVLVYYGEGKIRWYQRSFVEQPEFENVLDGSAAILPGPLNTPSEGCFSIGAFLDKDPFRGKLKRVLVFNEALDPNVPSHLGWFQNERIPAVDKLGY